MLLYCLLTALALLASAAVESPPSAGSCDIHQYASTLPKPPQDFDALINACHSSPPPSCLAASISALSSSNKRLRSAAAVIIRRVTSTLPCTASPPSTDSPFLSNRYHVFGPFPAGKNEVDGAIKMQCYKPLLILMFRSAVGASPPLPLDVSSPCNTVFRGRSRGTGTMAHILRKIRPGCGHPMGHELGFLGEDGAWHVEEIMSR
jgi:hypothetical protein